MDLGRPYSAIAPSLDGDALAVLAGTTRPLTGREVSRLVRRGSQRGVQGALERLVLQGVVHQQEAGRALLYTLNREHVAAPAIEALASLRAELIRRITVTVGEWEVRPSHVSIFGSFARGGGDQRSDIDLLIVRPEAVVVDDPRWREQLDDLTASVRVWSGNHAGIAEVSRTDVERLRHERPQIVGDMRRDALVLHGPDVETLLGEVT
jgi:predicted nucleotidyltransferase